MKDKIFLKWIRDRLVHVHGESPIIDYIHKLNAIIYYTPIDQETPNCLTIDQTKEIDAIKVY